jgi:hypothetical protein
MRSLHEGRGTQHRRSRLNSDTRRDDMMMVWTRRFASIFASTAPCTAPWRIQASAGDRDHFRLAGSPARPGAQCAVCGHEGGAGDGRSRNPAARAGNHEPVGAAAVSRSAGAEIAGEASEEASAASRCRGSQAAGVALPSGLRQLRCPDEILLVPRFRMMPTTTVGAGFQPQRRVEWLSEARTPSRLGSCRRVCASLNPPPTRLRSRPTPPCGRLVPSAQLEELDQAIQGKDMPREDVNQTNWPHRLAPFFASPSASPPDRSEKRSRGGGAEDSDILKRTDSQMPNSDDGSLRRLSDSVEESHAEG